MSKYDIMFELIQEKVDSGDLTLEQANLVNDIAYEMYAGNDEEFTEAAKVFTPADKKAKIKKLIGIGTAIFVAMIAGIVILKKKMKESATINAGSEQNLNSIESFIKDKKAKFESAKKEMLPLCDQLVDASKKIHTFDYSSDEYKEYEKINSKIDDLSYELKKNISDTVHKYSDCNSYFDKKKLNKLLVQYDLLYNDILSQQITADNFAIHGMTNSTK